MMPDEAASPNPYQPPQAPGRQQVITSGQREYLYAIATHQKGILLCLVVRVVLEVGFVYLHERYFRPIMIAEGVMMLLTAYFVTRAGMRLYGRFSGLYYGFVSITPFLGIFVLMTVDRATTLVLRHFGIRVGLLGAVRSDI